MIQSRVKDSVVRSDDPDALQEHADVLADVFSANYLEGMTATDAVVVEICGVVYLCTTELLS